MRHQSPRINWGTPPPEEAPEVCDTLRQKTSLSQTSEAEILYGTGNSENDSEVCDTPSEVYRKPVSTQDYGDW